MSDFHTAFNACLREAARKVVFSGPATKALRKIRMTRIRDCNMTIFVVHQGVQKAPIRKKEKIKPDLKLKCGACGQTGTVVVGPDIREEDPVLAPKKPGSGALYLKRR